MEIGKHARREIADEHIAQRAAAQRGEHGHQQHAENIRPLIHGDHCAGHGKGCRSDSLADTENSVDIGHIAPSGNGLHPKPCREPEVSGLPTLYRLYSNFLCFKTAFTAS